jgi:hypothetical protein
LPEFYDVRLTAYWGTTATASISTKKSGCARPETNTPVMAGGLGVSGQAFWNAAGEQAHRRGRGKGCAGRVSRSVESVGASRADGISREVS